MNRCWDQRAALTLLDRGGAGGLFISVSHAHVDKNMGQYSQNITENMNFFSLDYTFLARAATWNWKGDARHDSANTTRQRLFFTGQQPVRGEGARAAGEGGEPSTDMYR